MTTLDITPAATAPLHETLRTGLLDDLQNGTGYAIAFGGQGEPWLDSLADLVRNFGLETELTALLRRSDALLAPLESELTRVPQRFDVAAWVDALAVGESAEDLDAPRVPKTEDLHAPARSIPGIVLTQLLGLAALERQGLDVRRHRPVAVIGHSQGKLAVEAVRGTPAAEVLTIARLIGVATQVVGARRGLLGRTMVSVTQADPERVAQIVEGTGVYCHLRNGRRSVVLTGRTRDIDAAVALLEGVEESERLERERKATGGSGFRPVIEPLASQVAFHHPDLEETAELVAEWAERIGFDRAHAALLTQRAIVDPVDWVTEASMAMDAGAEWFLDLGPGDLALKLTLPEARPRGAGVVATTTRVGSRQLTAVGARPRRHRPWSSFAPNVVTLPDGTTRVETAFTKLTGKSPVLLAGMTPTTVDTEIVAAAANAGFWAELAGGGQVTEEIFADHISELEERLDPGATYQFNALFLDPYLWKLHLGAKRLVQKARTAGAPIDGVIVTAGIPEHDEAVALVSELRELGITHVVFKPGTVRQIREVLAIADTVNNERGGAAIIIQIEGGRAGGHHSWEDLDELLLATYADLRHRDNVVVCVGGGIGNPEIASSYLTGTWALAHDYPEMPVDGVLVGTAAMATLEATTSPQVKELLVNTPGTPAWVGAGTATQGMASGRSQLGADLHEIDNTFSRTGRLLDEVAGDAEAVEARREEIIDALDRTAKPWFGDLTTMTYGGLLERFVKLSGLDAEGEPFWLDISWQERFLELAHRTEGRLADSDRGLIASVLPTLNDVADGPAAIARLRETHADLDEVLLHPADRLFFVEVCRRPGKPVNFVPVIDGEVRRWWRSDSLWQAHDPRYDADQVCVIPGTASVAGITRADEPVAELLQRFEDACLDALLAAGRAACRVSGRRRVEPATGPVSLVLAAPDVRWAGRTVMNPVHRLGGTWIILDPHAAEHSPTGATLETSGIGARLDLPLDTRRSVTVEFTVDAATARGNLPVVTTDDAVDTTVSIVSGAVAGDLPEVIDGIVTINQRWTSDLIADHASVSSPSGGGGSHAIPDVLVGLAWPGVFATLADAVTEDGTPIVEGMLDLVHLDHQVRLTGPLPQDGDDLEITAQARTIEDTGLGRVVTIDVTVGSFATLTERLAITGRIGPALLTDPAVAGGAASEPVTTPRRQRARVTSQAPDDMRAFAAVTGDLNPIHTSEAAALLAGLGQPIVHGMWTSAHAQHVLAGETGRRVSAWTARFLAPVALGSAIEVRAERAGLLGAAADVTSTGAEFVDVTVLADGDVVMTATARLEAARTAYAFPGQGIQSKGMGMDGYQRCPEARQIWDRADRHTREALGFSILSVVRDNPTELTALGVTHLHPDGVLYLTQFTQVAMAVLGAAQMAELRAAGAAVDDAILAGHSVGEYNALAAVSGVISLEAVVEVVFQRGSVMHTLVPRDAEGRSDYRLAAIRPSQIGLADDDVVDYVESLGESSGEFLQIVNFNQRGSQYAIAGTIRGLQVLEDDVTERRARFGGKAAFILVPGIDVPFHSRVLQSGVPDFRARLEELLPEQIDPAILLGRYVPNLVPRPFSLERDFITEIVDLVGSEPLREVLDDFTTWSNDPERLCRRVLIELLAWQFASPVRWIETQDLMFAPESAGGLGVERFIEVGVGSAPTVANLASGTLKVIGRDGVDVLNVERDMAIVFGTDEDLPEVEDVLDEPETGSEAPVTTQAPVAAAPAGPSSQDAPDLPFSPADATSVLIAWWTKMRIDQCGAADSIESLCDGASSRRNQLLVDLGGELSLGAIDGAADADLVTLGGTVTAMARTYRPFGPVLTEALGDHLAKVFGPTGKRPSAIADRVTGAWQLGDGWVHHVTAEVAMSSREGTSVRGGDFGEHTALSSAGDVEEAIDAAVREVGRRHGIGVEMPQSASAGGGTVDAEALAEFTGAITGPDGVLASAAHLVLDHLGLQSHAAHETPDSGVTELVERVESELGGDWMKLTAPAFDAEKAVLLDDRWASAREDVARLGLGLPIAQTARFDGTGEAVAAQAGHWFDETGDDRFLTIAARARNGAEGAHAEEVAVVTGASEGSIAAAVVAELLAGGATVVATTSSINAKKVDFFKRLYRENARAGAGLWVVPANMASFADVDALASWVGTSQSATAAGATTVTKPALVPTLLVPFAAGPVSGDTAEAGPASELQTRILLWSVERLMGALAESVRDRDVRASLHVLLPGSPNRGMFGGDGAYGEAKAALDALVNKWHAERRWADKVTLTHAIIGWVRGTGLMGGNDPLVDAVEAAGVSTWSPEEMANELLAACSPARRAQAATAPVRVDLTGGLGEAALNMAELAAGVAQQQQADDSSEVDSTVTVAALPTPPTRSSHVRAPDWGEVTARPEDLVVIVGAGELGPYGSARTRYEMEVNDRLSAAGVLELAWVTGLVTWDETNGGWYDTESGENVAEEDLADRYEEEVRDRVGIRRYGDDGDMVDNQAPLLTSVFLDKDLTFTVQSKNEAEAMRASDPERTRIATNADGEWTVTRMSGTEIRVPRQMSLSRTVGGQIPTGFDATRWGISAEMVQSIDRVALWNLICTVDAFLSSGFTPSELMRWVHPTLVANTQGTGMGGMTSMRSLYIDTIMGRSTPNDILQEALPNVIAAHVVQSYVGSYGAMVHPVAACATTAVSLEEGVDKIQLGKAEVVVAGGFDDLGIEGIIGFGAMSATADSAAMAAKGIEDQRFSRANDRRYGGFVESQGGGTILLARGDVAARIGLPVLGVVAYAASFADGVHTSIPAPGLGALAAGRGGSESRLARSLAAVGVTADDISVLSKHDTSTGVNERNESELHERLAAALGRSEGNPLFVISQKTLTGHAKGGAAAFQTIGLCQVLQSGIVPPNRSLDCVMDELEEHEHLVWLRESLAAGPLKAGLVTSLGFGHVAGIVAVVHPQAFIETLPPEQRDGYLKAAEQRTLNGRMRVVESMYGGAPLYERPADRRLGSDGIKDREAGMLLDPEARLDGDGLYSCR